MQRAQNICAGRNAANQDPSMRLVPNRDMLPRLQCTMNAPIFMRADGVREVDPNPDSDPGCCWGLPALMEFCFGSGYRT